MKKEAVGVLLLCLATLVVIAEGLNSPSFCTRLGNAGSRHASLNSTIGKHSCVTCANGAACCDGEVCCDGGTGCCPADTACCTDTCCSNATQSCCPDPKYGGVCCEKELTYCCIPGGGYPSRCCPRWMVCCKGGRYGCCDPGTMQPVDDLTMEKPSEAAAAPSNVAYGLYVDAFGDFQSLKIDLTSGYVTSTNITGYNDWEETQRVFMYDAKKNLFYLLQANFLVDNNTHVINLYTVDPIAGRATVRVVEGAVETGQIDVTGFNFNDQTGLIVFSVQKLNSKQQVVAYNFYKLEPKTAAATLISTFPQPDGVDKFVGFFHALSPNGNTVYRVGYRDVVNQLDFGLGLTDISKPIATMQWIYNLPIPNGLGEYMSLNLYGDSFISLAEDSWGDLAVVQWSYQPTKNATILNQLYDAYNTPYFGPLVEFINDDQSLYAALVVYNTFVSDDLARWAITLTQLPSGSTTELVLFPWLLAKTDSVAALGIPAQ